MLPRAYASPSRRARARALTYTTRARARSRNSAGPNVTDGCDISFPQFCPPTVECAQQRFAGAFCEPQGAFEPQLCLPGHYCPDQYTMLPCPAGTFCMRGSVATTACPALSYCPAQTEMRRYYGGVLFSFLIDAALVTLFLYIKYRLEPARAIARRAKWEQRGEAAADDGGPGFKLKDARGFAARGADAEDGAEVYAPLVDNPGAASSKSILEEGFKICNAGIRLDIEFDKLTLVVREPSLPDGKTILSQVTGRIRPGRVTAIMGPSGAGKSTFLCVRIARGARGRARDNPRDPSLPPARAAMCSWASSRVRRARSRSTASPTRCTGTSAWSASCRRMT